MQLNPFGPQDETRDHAARILEIISERSLETVCGFNFITEFDRWREDFKHLLDRNRSSLMLK
jgi:hydroxyacylglutathione hydrolase